MSTDAVSLMDPENRWLVLVLLFIAMFFVRGIVKACLQERDKYLRRVAEWEAKYGKRPTR
jgi:hypothetical protein